MTAKLTAQQVNEMIEEASTAAHQASYDFFNDQLKGRDQFPCGFAWVLIRGIRKNSNLSKYLEHNGIQKSSFERAHRFWSPSKLGVQNVDCQYAGALAAAQVIESYGLEAEALSRWD